MSEGSDIGWEYTDEDIETDQRHARGEYTDFELMLEYHQLDDQEWSRLSNNEQSHLRWNYNKFGTTKD